jgi:hypothetical protein
LDPVALEGSKIFLPYEYGMDPELAGIYVDYEDVKEDGVFIQLLVLGSACFYEVCFYVDEWFCEPCRGFYYRGTCSHVDRGKRFIEKRGVLNV